VNFVAHQRVEKDDQNNDAQRTKESINQSIIIIFYRTSKR